jgi:hypothetical protein
LRQLGVAPEVETAREVLGVVVEIGFSNGSDVIAAYADGTSRFFSRDGGGIAGKDGRADVAEAARRVIAEARPLAVSVHEEAAREGVRADRVRFTFLTPGGPRVIEATKDESGGGASPLSTVFSRAAELRSSKAQNSVPGAR